MPEADRPVAAASAASRGCRPGPAMTLVASSATPRSVLPSAPTVGAYTHALGYSYSDDPQFMYCAEPPASLDAANWWLGSCGLSGGASGGPWM